jgi:endogenous inhibitor of DNA gyrase (YacG/DUF329 family)
MESYGLQRQCLRCGKTFNYPPWREDSAKFCSHECQTSYKTEASLVGKTCPTCGIEFKDVRSGNTYCSRKCANVATSKANSKGGYISRGYRHIRRNGKTVPEHRDIMEKDLGRALHPHEHIHHKNGERADNRPENLELWVTTNRQPKGQRLEDVVVYMTSFLSLYGYVVTKHEGTASSVSEPTAAVP